MRNKFLCVAADFGHVPREDPWTREVEEEPGEWPYRDATERLYHQCLGPNAASPLLDERGRIVELVNHYRLLAFSLAPELLAWLEATHPDAHAALVAADRASQAERRGRGNALARLSGSGAVIGALDSFGARFGRAAHGVRLPGDEADDGVLETLAATGKPLFTVLRPACAAGVKPTGSRPRRLETTRPYRWRSRRTPGAFVDVYFLDEALSERVGAALRQGDADAAARRLFERFEAGGSAQLVHVSLGPEVLAGDGGPALSRTLRMVEAETPVRLTNYGAFLDLFPPPQEVELRAPAQGAGPAGGAEDSPRAAAPRRLDAAWAAACAAILAHQGEAPGDLGAFRCSSEGLVRREARDTLGRRVLSVARLEVSRASTGERAAFVAAVHHRGRADFECWTLPAPEEGPARLAARLAAAFERPEPEFQAEARRLFGAEAETLEALPPRRRRDLLSDFSLATREAALRRRAWRLVLRRLGEDSGALLDALRALPDAEGGEGAEPPGTDLLRQRLAERFWAYARAAGESAAELEGLLRSARAAKLRLDEWELRAAVWRRLCAGESGPEDERLASGLGLASGPGSPPH